ncbi:hypothetical protein ABW286_21930 [Erwinia papayae]|uniref:Lipoprotein n=1 Tax=Erwinia papayae TaxID=206499 RepID=A0ABV3N7J0_9GAMM
MKQIVFSLIAATALLTGCVSQNKGAEISNRVSDQQRQINELNIRLQTQEQRTARVEEKVRNEVIQSSSSCYLNGARYSTGSVVAGKICRGSAFGNNSDASWQDYLHR